MTDASASWQPSDQAEGSIVHRPDTEPASDHPPVTPIPQFDSPARALSHLDTIGTPGGIADYLHACGVRGLRRRPTLCPVAVFVRAATGAQVRVFTATWHEIGETETHEPATLVQRDTPPRLGEFIREFDDTGRYDFLREGGTPR